MLTHRRPGRADRTRRPRRGVTLIELLIVFVIVGVITTFSTSAYRRYAEQQRVSKFVAMLGGDLQLGYHLAARSRQPVRIQLDAVTNQLRLVSAKHPDTVFVRRSLAEFGLTASNLTFTSGLVDDLFHASGLARESVVVSVKLGKYTNKLTMSRSGLLSVKVQ